MGTTAFLVIAVALAFLTGSQIAVFVILQRHEADIHEAAITAQQLLRDWEKRQ